jgi:hypothetical protein
MICGMKVLPTRDLNVDPHIIFVNLLNYKSTNIVVLPLQYSKYNFYSAKQTQNGP